jgi:glutaredoxin
MPDSRDNHGGATSDEYASTHERASCDGSSGLLMGADARFTQGERRCDAGRPRRRGAQWSVMTAARVVLYTKPGCHLCDDMRDSLQAALRGRGVDVTEHNIALSLDDFERYKHDIPVLVIDGREVARHRISEAALEAALRAAGLR